MPKDGKLTKDKILAHTKELVIENGFAGTSVDAILSKTGITKGAFFYHFKTKNHLAKALIEAYALEDAHHLESALKATEKLAHSPGERLLAFVQAFIDSSRALEEPPSCLYASYTNEGTQFDQETKALITQSILKWRETFLDLLKQAKVAESLNTDITALADQFAVIVEGAYILSKALNQPELTAKQLTHFKAYLGLLLKQ